jgi:hypothetical protein
MSSLVKTAENIPSRHLLARLGDRIVFTIILDQMDSAMLKRRLNRALPVVNLFSLLEEAFQYENTCGNPERGVASLIDKVNEGTSACRFPRTLIPFWGPGGEGEGEEVMAARIARLG